MPNEQRKAVKSGCAFLCVLSFAQAKESTVAHRAKPDLNNCKKRNTKYQ
ncbi:hypothetical protein [Lonepinella koalarum]|nr:hypothetical protein [Lonepinella koalarum]